MNSYKILWQEVIITIRLSSGLRGVENKEYILRVIKHGLSFMYYF